jgi:hypothetical protein
MTNSFRAAIEGMREAMLSAAGTTALYRRHGVDDIEVEVVFGQTGYEFGTSEDMLIGGHIQDAIIRAEDLPFKPRRQDRIVVGTKIYEALPIGGDSEGWRYSDAYETAYRIHLREIE